MGECYLYCEALVDSTARHYINTYINNFKKRPELEGNVVFVGSLANESKLLPEVNIEIQLGSKY